MALVFAPLGFAAASQAQLGDRLLFAINQQAFTQRQMEVYLLVHALSQPEAKPFNLARQWPEATRTFQEEMLILLENKRLGRFQPESKRVKDLAAQIQAKIAADPQLQATASRLELSSASLHRAVAAYLQVIDFRRLKQALSATSWIPDLQKNHVIRPYTGMQGFAKIEPDSAKQ